MGLIEVTALFDWVTAADDWALACGSILSVILPFEGVGKSIGMLS